MKTETVKLSQIELNAANPRTINKDKFDKLINSLLALPKMLDLRPIVVDNTMVALGGNMRYRALSAIADMSEDELKERLSGIRDFQKKTQAEQDNLVEYWLRWKDKPTAPVIKASELTDAEQREFIIKDNVGFGEWDMDALANEWDNDDLVDWGVNVWQEEAGKAARSVEDDSFNEDEDIVEARCKLGDVWEMGNHRLICGDSTRKTVLDELMRDDMADMYLTDPPYNVDYTGKTKDAMKIENDSMEDAAFRSFLTDCFITANSSMSPGAPFYIWHADSEGYNFRYAVKACGWLLKQCLIWNKSSMTMGRQDYQWKHEPCLYGWKPGAAHNWYAGRSEVTVIDFDRPNRNGEHPTMKPLGLFSYLINNSSKVGDVVLDSFGGSGTTLIACEQLGRKCRMIELDPHYCDVIIARWEKFTGNKAVKL